ncbi:hypothetical protein FD01_GL002456 [Lacticaseibacillus manihotivorans DSM 13343 = JCM 12514]|uniref:Bacteriocin immunity protein n=2 Tax=Lacticaseibacillus manihotivorans TaxID=88233 RepID=A0A0R1RFM5_9LACO|nr:hypothetical protein FD01_GL002456 [Lacticaseibacillus manihotivorans DSM 13343 = JCM 12514]
MIANCVAGGFSRYALAVKIVEVNVMSKIKAAQLAAQTQHDIELLTPLLAARPDQTPEMRDILDVLGQVHKKITKVKNPPALVNRLVNYIRVRSSAGKLHYPRDQEALLIDLSVIGQKAGWNGLYMADFSDKSQFYSIFEPMPRH